MVIEDAGAAPAVAINRALSPCFARRSGNAFFIKLRSNRLGRLTCHKIFEETPDNRGLRVVDFTVSPHSLSVRAECLDDLVAIGQTAARLAVFDAAPQTPSGFVSKVFQEHRIHGAFQANMEIRYFSF